MGVSNRVCSYHREVHKARHKASGAMVALKKILMHNAKEEGVSFYLMFRCIVYILFDRC